MVPADKEGNHSPPRGAKDKQQRTNTPATGNGDLFKLLANRNRNLYNTPVNEASRRVAENGSGASPPLRKLGDSAPERSLASALAQHES